MPQLYAFACVVATSASRDPAQPDPSRLASQPEARRKTQAGLIFGRSLARVVSGGKEDGRYKF
jgi:hypothetical protein